MPRTAPHTRAVAVAALVVVIAAGCIPTGPDPLDPSPWTATPSPDDGATSRPVASTPGTAGALACPAYDDADDVAYVVLDSHRFASVCTGMTFGEATAALPGAAIAGGEQCPWVGEIVDADPLHIQAITDPEDPQGGIRMFRMLYLADPATAPPHEVPATAEGVSIGSAREDVVAAYPAAFAVTQEETSRGPREQLVVAEAPGHAYVFDIVGGVVAEVTWGQGLDQGLDQGLGPGLADESCPP